MADQEPMADEERDDLRATAESIAVNAEELKEIELRKLELEPQDSETRDLSQQAEVLAQDIADKAREEMRLVDKMAEDASAR